MVADDNLRIVLCPICGSEGVLIHARGNNPDHESEEICPECEGACVTLVEVEPIDLDDLVDVLVPKEAVDIIMTELYASGGHVMYFLANDGKLFILKDGELEPVT